MNILDIHGLKQEEQRTVTPVFHSVMLWTLSTLIEDELLQCRAEDIIVFCLIDKVQCQEYSHHLSTSNIFQYMYWNVSVSLFLLISDG